RGRCLAFNEVDVDVRATDDPHQQQDEGTDHQLGPQRYSSVHRTAPFVRLWMRHKHRDNYRASGGGAANGMATVNVVPSPTAVLTDAWPPWASAIDATMASPSPAPPIARERALSTR